MITRVVYFGGIRVKVKVSTCFRRNELWLGVKVRLGGQVKVMTGPNLTSHNKRLLTQFSLL